MALEQDLLAEGAPSRFAVQMPGEAALKVVSSIENEGAVHLHALPRAMPVLSPQPRMSGIYKLFILGCSATSNCL